MNNFSRFLSRFWTRIGLQRTLFGRLLLAYTGLAVFGLVIIGVLMSFLAAGYIRDQNTEELTRVARRASLLVQQVMQDPANGNMPQTLSNLLPFIGSTLDVGVGLFNDEGAIVAASADSEAILGAEVPKEIFEQVRSGKVFSTSTRLVDQSPSLLVAAAPIGEGDQIIGGVLVYTPLQDLQHTTARIRETILWVALVVLLLSIGVGSYVSWSISRPLRLLRRIVADIGSGSHPPAPPIPVDTDDEIGELATAIVDLDTKLTAAELQRRQAEEGRRRLLADVSHELRTPLTTMLGFTEALLDQMDANPETRRRYLRLIHEQTLHLGRLVEDLLELSRLEAGDIRLVMMPVDLAGLVNNVAERLRPAAEREDIAINVSVTVGAAPVIGDPDRLEQIVTNLTANAMDVSVGGQVDLLVGAEGDEVFLEVRDTGPGIDPSDLPYIWERFYRSSRSNAGGSGSGSGGAGGGGGGSSTRKGSGLGLAIVRQLVQLHNGQVAVETNPGAGTRFRVQLPKAHV